MVLAGVKKRMEMPNRRQVVVPDANGVASTCGVCGGLYRTSDAPEGRFGICPGCRSEAVLLSGMGDPRASA